MPAPAYALVNPSMKHTAATLAKWLAETPGFKPGLKMSKEDMIVRLNAARQAYWDKAHKEANAAVPSRAHKAAAKAATRADLCLIAADEWNAWLRTLPPVPLA